MFWNEIAPYLVFILKTLISTVIIYSLFQVDFFFNEKSTDEERALNMLQIWAGDDEDASPENLSYTLEGLEMFEAAEALKEITELMNG